MANGDNVNNYGNAYRGLPGAINDGVNGAVRLTRRGETFTSPISKWRFAAADEGSYFVAHNATNDASTTIAGHAAPILADADVTMTKPLISLLGGQASSSLVRCYLDFIQIEVVTAGTTGTQSCWAAQLDTGTTRITTAGTALTMVNPNMQSSATPVLLPTAGAIVTGAESASVRHLGHGTLRPSIEVAGDIVTFVFGGDPDSVLNAIAAASVRNHMVPMPPVILGPTDSLLLALHSQASQNAAGVYKIRMGWVEK